MSRVVITVDGTTWLDADVSEADVQRQEDWVELRESPLMAMAFAGAPPEAILGTPYIERTSYLHMGAEVVLRLTFRVKGTGEIHEGATT